jgi:CHAT domain-containing protein/F0F1-type ATP synthase beta subunit
LIFNDGKNINHMKKFIFLIAWILPMMFLKAQDWETLNQQGVKLYQEGKYAEAMAIFEKAKTQAKKEFGKDHPNYATSCNNLGLLYQEKGLYSKAEPLYVEAKKIREKVLGKEHPSYAISCNNLAYLYSSQGLNSKAEPLYVEAKNIVEKILGKEHPDYATSCNNLAHLYSSQGLYSRAEPLYVEAKNIREKVLGKEHPDYATSCNNLAGLYKAQGFYLKAEPLYVEARNIYEKILGKEHPDYATTCNNLAGLYDKQGLYSKAEPLYVEAKNIRAKVFGKEHPDYASSCNNLASLYYNQGLYSKAEPLYVEAKNIRAKVLGKEHPDYASSCNNLASLYEFQGLYSKAEPLYLEAKNIRAKVLGKEHPSYATTCNNLAALYKNQGLYSMAEPLFLEAKNILEKVLGKEHPDYATSCNNLGLLYSNQGLYTMAEPLYVEAKNIREKVLSKEHPDYASSCNNLADLFENQGLYSKAEPLYVEARNIYLKVFGKEHPDYATTCNNLAGLHDKQGLYSKAEPLYVEAKNIRAKVFGKEHPSYATSCNNLAELYEKQGFYSKAEPIYLEAISGSLAQIENNFSHLSEKEKALFYKSFAYYFEAFNSFSLKRYSENPSILSHTYNHQLATKALLFNTSVKIKERILSSKDQNLIDLYANWKAKREYLAKVYQMSLAEKEKKGINQTQLEAEVNELEKQLSSKSELFATAHDKRRYTWQDVQQQLKKGEAAVEMIRTRYYDKKWTDSVVYIALIVKPETKNHPEIVVLADGNAMEKRGITYYRNCIKFTQKDEFSYNKFWKPIRDKIGTAQKVYFSADGVYHQLNLLTLQNPETGKYVSEETNIQLVSNTKDLVLFSKPKQLQKNFKDYQLHLFGFPDYGDKASSTNKDRGTFAIPLDSTQRFFDASGSISKLPGTKTEVENIGNFAKTQNLKTFIYTNKQASEDNLKKLTNPDILHIATHGFFLADVPITNEDDKMAGQKREVQIENPLLRCGLLLADAQEGLKNGEQEGKENGVLTAQEAMNLNLDNTDLVVLSACETGLGEIVNGEGVFGLQRAFQTAGAKTVLMSLWKVDDTATQEMMSVFYENLLVKKLPKREAFTQAQNKLKEKYGSPYYWGAFVMVGE